MVAPTITSPTECVQLYVGYLTWYQLTTDIQYTYYTGGATKLLLAIESPAGGATINTYLTHSVPSCATRHASPSHSNQQCASTNSFPRTCSMFIDCFLDSVLYVGSEIKYFDTEGFILLSRYEFSFTRTVGLELMNSPQLFSFLLLDYREV